MKYIDADKIRTEVKRLKAENNCGTDEFIAAKDIAYDKVFDFLETLEEPVTDCHDLEEAKEEYIRKDALMEWLEGMMTKEGATEGFVGGYDFALKDVINKLNEL